MDSKDDKLITYLKSKYKEVKLCAYRVMPVPVVTQHIFDELKVDIEKQAQPKGFLLEKDGTVDENELVETSDVIIYELDGKKYWSNFSDIRKLREFLNKN